MPLYEYLCLQCNSQNEVLIRNADERATCPKCGSKKMNRLLSVVAAPSVRGKSQSMSPPAGVGCGRQECGSGQCMFGD